MRCELFECHVMVFPMASNQPASEAAPSIRCILIPFLLLSAQNTFQLRMSATKGLIIKEKITIYHFVTK